MTDSETCGHETPTGPCKNPATDGEHCWIDSHGGDVGGHGRPSKFEDTKDDLLAAAREPIKTRDVARSVGIGESTLFDWLDQYDDFSESFRRARAEAARDLVARGLEDPDVDTSMVRFLLERTFKYIKTQEIEHTGDGLTINVPDEAADY